MTKLHNMQWLLTSFCITPILISAHKSPWALTLALSALAVIYLTWTVRNRTVAVLNKDGMWLQRHGQIGTPSTVSRNGSMLIVTGPEGKEYVEICSYCFTSQIDQFASDCRKGIDRRSTPPVSGKISSVVAGSPGDRG